MKRLITLVLILLLSISLISCGDIYFEFGNEDFYTKDDVEDVEESNKELNSIKEDGFYTNKAEVSLYIYTYGRLPNNYITKKEADNLGWESNKGNLWDVTDKMSIGGDRFGNREKSLPIKEKRTYYECDIDYQGGYRGAERLVYSNDGLIYYTGDHYETFTLLYGDE